MGAPWVRKDRDIETRWIAEDPMAGLSGMIGMSGQFDRYEMFSWGMNEKNAG